MPDSQVTIYLTRHGETEWNVAEILQGQEDSPLTETGLQQAHQIGEQFADIEFSAIYSSDIGRAKTTAEIIAQYHHLQVQTSDLIRERYFGKYQGMKADIMEEKLKAQFQLARELPKDEHLDFVLDDDVETDRQIVNRLYRFFQKVSELHSNQVILTVCHGALMRAFLIYIDYARYGQLDSHSIDNLGHLVLRTDGHQVTLLKAKGIHLHA